MKLFKNKLLKTLSVSAVVLITAFGLLNIKPIQQVLAATIPTSVASFQTSLATGISKTDTTMSLVSLNTSDGITLTDGSIYGFTIDEGTANQEYVIGTVETSDNTVISMTRGVSVITGSTSITDLKKTHRRGASIKVTDHPVLTVLSRILNGIDTIPNKLTYNSVPTLTADTDIATKRYVDDVVIGGTGALDASSTVKGFSKLSVNPATANDPIAIGTNDQRIQSSYVVDSAGSDSYVINPIPAFASYVAGQTFTFKAGTANTGAATLNVNSLGAKTIKKDVSTDLATGDILQNQIITVMYDGTNMQLVSKTSGISPIVRVYTSSGTWTKPSGLTYAIVEVVGGGGNTQAAQSGEVTGAGGAGGYVQKTYTASDLNSTETYVVGAATQNSTFKSLTAGGGSTGAGSNSTSAGGSGGTATGGDININGQNGSYVSASSFSNGSGGSSVLGLGGVRYSTGGIPSTGTGYGAGSSSSFSTSAGSGTSGVVIIKEFYN